MPTRKRLFALTLASMALGASMTSPAFAPRRHGEEREKKKKKKGANNLLRVGMRPPGSERMVVVVAPAGARTVRRR